jgi:hypothetical protein
MGNVGTRVVDKLSNVKTGQIVVYREVGDKLSNVKTGQRVV